MTHNHLVSSDKPCATTVVSSLARVAFLEVTSASQACMKPSIHVTIPQTWHIMENNFIMPERNNPAFHRCSAKIPSQTGSWVLTSSHLMYGYERSSSHLQALKWWRRDACMIWQILGESFRSVMPWMMTTLHLYHSKGETSGHFTNRYIPLLYLKLGGFFM